MNREYYTTALNWMVLNIGNIRIDYQAICGFIATLENTDGEMTSTGDTVIDALDGLVDKCELCDYLDKMPYLDFPTVK